MLHAPARSGTGDFDGVCSTYLQTMEPGSTVFVFTRQPTIPFRPPADPSVPMIMIGAGTGLAPFRGFLQERAAQKASGGTLAPSLLFFGCRTPADRLYADELDGFAQTADVLTYTVFSRQPTGDRKYAQHEMLAHQDEVWDLIERGARIFVCGNARTLAPGVRAALQQIYADKRRYRRRRLARRPATRTSLSGRHLGSQLTDARITAQDGQGRQSHGGSSPTRPSTASRSRSA